MVSNTLKIHMLNIIYNAGVMRKDEEDLAKHIVGIAGFDDQIHRSEVFINKHVHGEVSYDDELFKWLDLVNEITNFKGKSKRCYYVFASKYCSFHNPYYFPIMDSHVRRVVSILSSEFEEKRITIKELCDPKNYRLYKRILLRLMAFLSEKPNYKDRFGNLRDLDCFLWMYAKRFEHEL